MKRFLSVVLAIALIFACAPVIPFQADAATIASGTCGSNVIWTLETPGVLTISGTGKMTDYFFHDSPPWDDYRSVIKSVIIEAGVTNIGSCAFYVCYNLTSVVIGDSVTSIGDDAFRECSSLTSVVIPDSVTSIGDYAFACCSSLASVVIGDSVTSIGDYAFADCSSLTSVEIPDSVTSIGYKAFLNCSSLTSVIIGDSVTSIGDSAFSSCSSLTGIWVDADNTAYCSDEQGVLYNKAKTTLIRAPAKGITGTYTIPDSVTYIGDYAFLNCSSLTSVVIGDSVTSIGERAFLNCSSLTSVVIGDSVTYIGDWVFSYCSSLTDVYYGGNLAQWNEIMIASGNDYLTNATIHTTESEPVLIGISVAQKPNKTEYVLGEALDTTGLVLAGSYSNSSTAEITDGFAISGFDSATTGTKTITVTYEGYITTFTVTVDLPKVCQNLGTGEKFTTLEEAFVVVADGTIQLLMDATADALILNPGVNLDLNGYTLTARYLIVMQDAAILDGAGNLKIAKKNLVYAQEQGNGIIPVWNGTDGYLFTRVTFQQMANPLGNGAAQYLFLPSFSNGAVTALMADGGSDNGLKFKVNLVWNNGQIQQLYTYEEAFVKQVFDGTYQWVFTLHVTGIGSIEDMTASAMVVADCDCLATNVSTAIVAG